MLVKVQFHKRHFAVPTWTFLSGDTLKEKGFIRAMETSVYYPPMSLSWLYKQHYKTLNSSCQVSVLEKVIKQAIFQVTNPCRQRSAHDESLHSTEVREYIPPKSDTDTFRIQKE